MLKSISIVEAKRNAWDDKHRRVNHVKGDIVYLIRAKQSDGGVFKIGVTKNLTSRIQAYKNYLGREVQCLAQIVMKDRKAADDLEAAFIRKLSEGPLLRGREWFRMDYSDVRDFMLEVIASKPSGIVRIHGMPGPVHGLAAQRDYGCMEVIGEATRRSGNSSAGMWSDLK